MTEKKVYLRLIDEDDIKYLYDLRNNPKFRTYHHNTEPIDYRNHEKWFRSVLRDVHQNAYIILNENLETIGQIRFERVEGRAIIDIAIDEKHQGKGYGTAAVRQATKLYFFNYPVHTIFATIKLENKASQKIFENAGFCIKENLVNWITYFLENNWLN